jgi:hypothetical protein
MPVSSLQDGMIAVPPFSTLDLLLLESPKPVLVSGPNWAF